MLKYGFTSDINIMQFVLDFLQKINWNISHCKVNKQNANK